MHKHHKSFSPDPAKTPYYPAHPFGSYKLSQEDKPAKPSVFLHLRPQALRVIAVSLEGPICPNYFLLAIKRIIVIAFTLIPISFFY